MMQSLVINGKEYLPSNALAERFGYTSDYIGKLAREEKILATLIGRQWFVEPESLRVFLLQAELSKKLRQEELRAQRKLERQAHGVTAKKKEQVATTSEFMAFAQTAVVVLCGVLLGSLGWTVSNEQLSLRDLSGGVVESATFIAQSMVPVSAPDLYIAASVESLWSEGNSSPYSENAETLIFTSLPQFPVREPLASTTPETTTTVHGFSDEVQVITGGDGSEMIVPIFKKGEGTQQFLLVPINAHTQ